MVLYGYNVSPYTQKVRAILKHKGLSFEERMVHPLRRGVLRKLTGQVAVPVLEDRGQAISDSSRIVRYLDETYPDRRVIPTDPMWRGRALLAEDWSDEALSRVVAPLRWLVPFNQRRTMAMFRSAYPPRFTEELAWQGIGRVVIARIRKRYGGHSQAEMLNRLAEVLDFLDGALAETGWLAGPEPTVADFAVWSWLHFLEEMDGWETVKARKRVFKLVKALSGGVAGSDTEDAHDAALRDASHHRRTKKRLPVV